MIKLVKRRKFGFANESEAIVAWGSLRRMGLAKVDLLGDGYLAIPFKEAEKYENELMELGAQSYGSDLYEIGEKGLKAVGSALMCKECKGLESGMWVYRNDPNEGDELVWMCLPCIGRHKVRVYGIKDGDHVTVNGGF
jgi:hypothetical protein